MIFKLTRKKYLYDHLNYTIDENGKVKNERSGRYLSFTPFRGFLTFHIEDSTCNEVYRLHYAVADHFLPNPNNWDYIIFKDGNKENCAVGNLKWAKRPENKGKPVIQYNLNGKEIKRYASITEAAEATNISRTNIQTCCSGVTKQAGGYKWKRVD